jgi:hypothetical protein
MKRDSRGQKSIRENQGAGGRCSFLVWVQVAVCHQVEGWCARELMCGWVKRRKQPARTQPCRHARRRGYGQRSSKATADEAAPRGRGRKFKGEQASEGSRALGRRQRLGRKGMHAAQERATGKKVAGSGDEQQATQVEVVGKPTGGKRSSRGTTFYVCDMKGSAYLGQRQTQSIR